MEIIPVKTANNIYDFLATGFFTGKIPFAPGTMGSLAALGLSLFLTTIFPFSDRIENLIFTILFSITTFLSAPTVVQATNDKDPAEVVMDEFAGMSLTLAFVTITPLSAVLAFLLFRIFDILKPWPIYLLQDLRGAAGILIDDLVAGLAAGIVLLILQSFLPI